MTTIRPKFGDIEYVSGQGAGANFLGRFITQKFAKPFRINGLKV